MTAAAETPQTEDGGREELLGMVPVQGRAASALRLGRWLRAVWLPVPLPVPNADAHPERRQSALFVCWIWVSLSCSAISLSQMALKREAHREVGLRGFMFRLWSSFVPTSHVGKWRRVLLSPGFARKPLPVPFAERLVRDLHQCPSSCVVQQRRQLPCSCSSLPGSPGKVLVLSACPEATPCPWGWCQPSGGLSPTSQDSAQGRALCPCSTLTSPMKGNVLLCMCVRKKEIIIKNNSPK